MGAVEVQLPSRCKRARPSFRPGCGLKEECTTVGRFRVHLVCGTDRLTPSLQPHACREIEKVSRRMYEVVKIIRKSAISDKYIHVYA